MENSLSSIKGQALFEFYVVIIILIPLCVMGLKVLGQSGEKRLNEEKNRFLSVGTQNIVSKEDLFLNLSELETDSIHVTPTGFEFNGKKIGFVEDAAGEKFSDLKSSLKEEGWKEVEENGIFVFLREDQRKYAWKMDGGFTLLGD